MHDKKKIVRYVFIGAGLGFFLLAPIFSTIWFALLSSFREVMFIDYDTELPGYMLGMLFTLSGGFLGGFMGYVVCSRLPQKEVASNNKHNVFLRFAAVSLWGVVYAFMGAAVGLTFLSILFKVIDSAPDSPLHLYALAGGPIGMIVGLWVSIYTRKESAHKSPQLSDMEDVNLRAKVLQQSVREDNIDSAQRHIKNELD